MPLAETFTGGQESDDSIIPSNVHQNHKSARILIVEDEQFSRTLMLRHLNREGFTDVTEAVDGKQALELLRQQNFDLVLSDLQMPEMDGLELLRQMKQDTKLALIPLIIVSSIEETHKIAESIEFGAEDHLAKPFNPYILRARVNACLEKKRLRDQEKKYLLDIKREKKRSEELINVIFPAAVSYELRTKGSVSPRRCENVAILFCDIIGFTKYCEENPPEVVASNLQTLFEAYEEVTQRYQMEKIKTIGDAFMAAAGLTNNDNYPLHTAIKCGLEMAEATLKTGIGWQVRIGVNAGPVVAGVVGKLKYSYDVWGNTVNIASRMTGQASANTVAMSVDCWLKVQDDFKARTLGMREIKGIGNVEVVECYEVADEE